MYPPYKHCSLWLGPDWATIRETHSQQRIGVPVKTMRLCQFPDPSTDRRLSISMTPLTSSRRPLIQISTYRRCSSKILDRPFDQLCWPGPDRWNSSSRRFVVSPRHRLSISTTNGCPLLLSTQRLVARQRCPTTLRWCDANQTARSPLDTAIHSQRLISCSQRQ